MDIDESPSSSGRAKREKKDKHGRAAAFEKLKKLKGTKNKYQVDEIVNVYDVVDEKEFSKKQTALQQEDWIVDDGDGGYIEDGREIFDDDMDPDSIQKNSKEANRLVGPKKRKRDEATKSKNAGGNIMSMIQGMPLKKKREETSQVNHENILEIMLQDLEKEKSSSSSSQKPKVNSKNVFKIASTSSTPKSNPFKPSTSATITIDDNDDNDVNMDDNIDDNDDDDYDDANIDDRINVLVSSLKTVKKDDKQKQINGSTASTSSTAATTIIDNDNDDDANIDVLVSSSKTVKKDNKQKQINGSTTSTAATTIIIDNDDDDDAANIDVLVSSSKTVKKDDKQKQKNGSTTSTSSTTATTITIDDDDDVLVSSLKTVKKDDKPKQIDGSPQKLSNNKKIVKNISPTKSDFTDDFDGDICDFTDIDLIEKNALTPLADKPKDTDETKPVDIKFGKVLDSIDEKHLKALMIRKSKTQNSSCINNNNKSTNCSIKSSTIDNSSLLDNNEFEKLVASIDQDKLYAQMINKNSKKMNKIVDEKMTANEEKINIPLIKNNEGEMLLRFYWLDAIEDPQNKPGVVTLFGKIYINKTKTYESCCVIVKNIPRRIYCLPREKVKKNKLNDNEYESNTMEKVYEEWNAEATKRRITNYRCKKIEKNYAFDREGTPLQSKYLEVRYPAEFPPIESTYSGETIEHIFNTTVNPLELFLIEREIKGPCWLEIKSPIQTDNFNTWSKYQVNCLKMENINVYNSNDNNNNSNIPYVSMATMNIRTTLNSKTQQNEITMIGLLSNKNYHIDKPPLRPPFDNHCCFVTRPKDTQWPLYARDKIKKFQETTIIFCETEIELLEKFLDKYQSIDPDFIIGYDCGFQFDVLIRRLTNLKIKNWMRTSKLKGTFNVFINGKVNLSRSFCGRAICDVQTAAKEVNLKVRNYDLDTLCSTVLKTKTNTIIDIKPCDCPNFYNEIIKIIGLIKITMMEVNYILSLICEMNIIPLALQITCIAGNVLSRTLNAGRSERNEYLLLHAFHKKDYITPDRKLNIKSSNANSSKAKSAYIGGLVLEPQRGFYDQLVLLMDFNSLYPSIIQEYNLCFSTIPGICYRDNIDPIKDLPNDDVEIGIVPTQIRKLVESRREVKKLLKTPNLTAELKMQYNIRQLALKLTANSMYGCLGASHCRFYAKHLAALVTTKGRDILQNTKALVEKLNYQVIYGDTDSIMINSKIINYDEAYGIAKKIKIEVNKLYKQIELDIDGLFKYMLLLNKKKYAAVSINKLPNGKYQYETEIKGLDVVRRDWCQLACDTGKKIIDHIFMDLTIEEKTCKIRELLNQIANDVNNNKLPLSSYVITKQLSKNPKDYPDNKQPHVAIALRLNKEGGRMWKKDDTVPYIICLDTTTRTPTERAYHIDEFKKNDELKIDIDYYLSCQIIPVAERITQPIPELDGGFLAESLGIKNYKSKNTAKMNQAINNNDDDDNNTDEDDLKKYENCESFKFTCRNTTCGAVNEVRSFMREDNVGLKKPVMLECINKKCKLPPWKYVDVIKNDLQTTIRLKIQRYYGPTIQCQNTECLKICKRFGIGNADKSPTCIKCQKVGMIQEYTAADFYNQLEFYEQLFNSSKEDSTKDQRQLKLNYPVEMINACNSLNQFVENYLKHNAYTAINFDSLYFFTKKKCWDPSSYQKAV